MLMLAEIDEYLWSRKLLYKCIELNSVFPKIHVHPEPVNMNLLANRLCRCNQVTVGRVGLGWALI